MSKDGHETIDQDIQDVLLDIDGREVTVGDLFAIDDTNIVEEFGNQAARYAYIGLQTALAEAAFEEAKAAADFTRAKLDGAIRAEPDHVAKKPTETAIAGMIEEDPEYQLAMGKSRECRTEFKILRAVEAAMRQRGDMLVSLGATLRQEYDVTDMAMKQAKEVLRSKSE